MVANDGRRLVQTLKACLAPAAAQACVLATVVRTAGSTYRKAGAQMLVPADGAAIGILSGGCLEDDIVDAARGLLAAGGERRTALLFFDLMPESEFLVGYGKGCSGQLTVFLERVAPGDEVLVRLVVCEEACAVALVYEAGGGLRPGDRVLLAAGGERVGALPAGADAGVDAALAAALRDGATASITTANGAKACVYRQKPPQDLLVFGAGPDAPAVVATAAQLGWAVRVLDHRPARLAPERFAVGTSLVHYNPETLGDDIVTSAASAVVVMTHNLLVDAEILKWAAARPLAYLGLLGPAHRRERIFRWLLSQGHDLEAALAGRLFAPIGLDLGGDGECDIALAIIAQIQQLRHAATGAHKAAGGVELDGRRRGAAMRESHHAR